MSNEDIQIDERSGVLYAVVERNGDYVFKADGHRFQVRVEAPCKPIKRGYYSDVVRAWDPEVDEPQLPNIRADLGYRNTTNSEQALLFGEMMFLAAELYEALMKWYEPVLSEQIARHKEHEEREQREQEEKDRAKNELKELLQNYIGTNFKLKRDGYRATVFGTVDRLDERTLYTTSERGVKMTTSIKDISFFAVKWDGERRYETVYDRKAVVG